MTAKLIWTFGFLIGTITHTIDLINYGWLPYEFRPLIWNAYWTSLTFLDPLAAALIWLSIRSAILLGLAIMVSNIIVNGYTLSLGYGEFLVPLMFQASFAMFVFWFAWRHWSRDKKAKTSV